MSAPTRLHNPPQTPPNPFTFDPIPSAIQAIASGQFVIVMDDESRENEGDLVCAAGLISAEGMGWLVRHSSGFICTSLPPKTLSNLSLPPLLPTSGKSQDPKQTAYHLTVDSNPKRGHPVTTGISGWDRAWTARLLGRAAARWDGVGEGMENGNGHGNVLRNGNGTVTRSSTSEDGEVETKVSEDDFTRPGHMVTLRYTPGGTRVRRGHTEAAVDLCYLANLPPAGVLCEITHPTDPKGGMARRDDCWRLAKEWGLVIVSVEGIAEWVEENGGVPR